MTDTSPSPPRSIQFLGWAVLLSFWFCLGLNLLINGILLREIVANGGPVRLPETTREAVWLVITMWLVAYIAGFVVGLNSHVSRRDLIASSVAGYLAATVLYLMLLGIFPGTPVNSYDVLRDIFSLEPMPVYFIFVFLTLILGPIVSGLATYTSILLIREMPQLQLSPNITIDAPATIFAVFATLSFVLMFVAIPNVQDIDSLETTTRDYRQIVRDYNRVAESGQQQNVPSIVLLHLNYLANPIINILTAAFIGLLIGSKRTLRSPLQAGISAGIGIALYVVMMFLIIEIIEPKTSVFVSYKDVYGDSLGSLPAPSTAHFLVFWFVPPLVAAGSAFGLRHMLVSMGTSPAPQPIITVE